MTKCWLIRTKNNHVLGPVSKKKILELLAKGTIRPEDEVTSGDGYWFFVKEEELVQRYLNGDIKQNFNPVSEAPPLATVETNNVTNPSQNLNISKEEDLLPLDSDLEFPDMGDFSAIDAIDPPKELVSDEVHLPMEDDLELPTIELAIEDNSEDRLPEGSDLDLPSIDEPVEENLSPVLSQVPAMTEDSTGEIKVDTHLGEELSNVVTMDDIRGNIRKEPVLDGDGVLPNKAPQKFMASGSMAKTTNEKRGEVDTVKTSSLLSEKKLVLVGWLVFLVIAIVIYFRHQSIKDIIVDKLSGSLIQDADAQELGNTLIKKKTSQSN